jgi:hypothetical protein
MRRKFFGSVRALPSRKLPFHYSPIAIRYSLPFSAQRGISLPFCPPTEVGGYENEAC